MKIIKVAIEVTRSRGGTRIVKQAVSFQRRMFTNIAEFIEHVQTLCKLNGVYGLYLDGFGIADGDTVKMLEEGKVYRMKIIRQSKKERIFKQHLDSESSESIQENVEQSQQEDQSENISEEEESTPIIKPIIKKKEQVKNKRPSKIEQKKQKIQRKKRVIKEDSQSSSSSSSEIPVSAPKKNKKVQPIFNKKVTISQVPKEKIQTQNNKPVSKVAIPQNKVVVRPIQKKAIILQDSESQSSPSPSPEKQLKPQPVNKPATVKSPQPRKLPPAIRNKMGNSFGQHQENQWLPLDSMKAKKWQQDGHTHFCQPPNKIRFKIIEFDQQKFIPVKSGWINGQVSSVINGTITLVRVEEVGKDFRKEYKIPELNMDQLQIWKPLATKQQLSLLQSSSIKQPLQQVPKEPKFHPQAQVDQTKKQQNQSVQKYICGQINYYFSDKNYNTDFFMQLHANNHPQKYIKISFMLNFPKVKKMIKDTDKLLQYLRDDEKYDGRTYEIDFEGKMIRKKHILDPSVAHKSQEKKNGSEVNKNKESQEGNREESKGSELVEVQKQEVQEKQSQ